MIVLWKHWQFWHLDQNGHIIVTFLEKLTRRFVGLNTPMLLCNTILNQVTSVKGSTAIIGARTASTIRSRKFPIHAV